MKKSLTKEQVMQILRKELPYLRDKYGVERIALYGSFAKGSPTTKSDVDILVQLVKPLGLEFVGLAYYLEETLGRKVDLATFDTLHRSLENPRYKRIAGDIQRTLRYV
ncbi:MAG: nucleotidyltransferase family protein [Candidatus Tectomicrobia bacterium]|uniref:Nucleotidyltransferase family protein n=1 Tax=Tectimicrobiota bacterium TaxID=2528274 RepID=A0A932M1T2_UNCTE|nr:nucleotidyltransferase family protein [Candidatus Tectomicrobia bacterium]